MTLSLSLPVRLAEESRRSEFAQRYCKELGKRLGYTDRPGFDHFADALAEIVPLFGMSFREIDVHSFTTGLWAEVIRPLRSKPELWQVLVVSRAAHGVTFKGALPPDETGSYEEFRRAFKVYQGVEAVFAYWARRLDLQVQ